MVNLEIDKLPAECALGIKWNVEMDKFIWEVREETLMLIRKLPTRRGMLSVIYSLFDPLGFIVCWTFEKIIDKINAESSERKTCFCFEI